MFAAIVGAGGGWRAAGGGRRKGLHEHSAAFQAPTTDGQRLSADPSCSHVPTNWVRLVQPLVGRADEVAVLDRFLADTVAEPRALLIDGEPGIGKTTLLRHLVVGA